MNSTRISRLRRLLKSGAARAVREAAGISLSEAAADVGAAKSTLSRWETSRRTPRMSSAALRYLELLEELSR